MIHDINGKLRTLNVKIEYVGASTSVLNPDRLGSGSKVQANPNKRDEKDSSTSILPNFMCIHTKKPNSNTFQFIIPILG